MLNELCNQDTCHEHNAWMGYLRGYCGLASEISGAIHCIDPEGERNTKEWPLVLTPPHPPPTHTHTHTHTPPAALVFVLILSMTVATPKSPGGKEKGGREHEKERGGRGEEEVREERRR